MQNNKQFIEDCKRRTPTARINTGTGKMLDEALARIAELEVKLATIATLTAERDEWKAIAQSYDGCLEGIALKLERKKVAGLVLENRAYDLRMDNDGKRIDELEAELSTVKESLTTAEATIDKLRAKGWMATTLDGVEVILRLDNVWITSGSGDIIEVPAMDQFISHCYSTKAAALAAKGGG